MITMETNDNINDQSKHRYPRLPTTNYHTDNNHVKNKANKFIRNLDYLLPIVIWLLIFGKNLFSKFLFIDFTYNTYFDVPKTIFLSNYSYVLSLLDIVKLVFALLNILPVLFQFSILIFMLLSFFYIKRLFKSKSWIFILLFSLIFFFNPFVYSRIMTGQLGVLLSYLLMPLFIFYLFQFFESNLSKKSLIKLLISMTLVSLFSIHFFIINIILLITASIFLYFYKNPNVNFKKYIKSAIIIAILLILLNSFWLQSVFSNKIYSSIDESHEEFFSPKMSADIPAVAKIIGMSGFWRESGYKSLFSIINLGIWYLLIAFLIIAILTGYFISNSKKSKFFYTLFWTGVILGTGISHPYTKPFFDFLFNYLPFFNGLRDSHKFVSLIAISYAYFIPIFMLELGSYLKKLKFIPVLLLIAFVIFFTFPMINIGNQIKPTSYPDSYYQVNDFIKNQEITGKIIYLPWQTYLTYTWTMNSSSDGRIATPINQIIQQPVIVGADKWGSQINSESIDTCIKNKDLSCLEQNSVQFILKDKCTLFPDKYEWIKDKPRFETSCLDVYKINSQESKSESVPLRFIIGIIISLMTLIALIIVLIKKTNCSCQDCNERLLQVHHTTQDNQFL
jgi:hypothetical protein